MIEEIKLITWDSKSGGNKIHSSPKLKPSDFLINDNGRGVISRDA